MERDFGGLEGLKKDLNAKTAAIQGSGWGWVVRRVLVPPNVSLLY